MLFLAALFAPALILQQIPPAVPTTATTPAPAGLSATALQTEPTTLPTVNVAVTSVQPTQTCRTEAVTGSRFGRRVCRSAVQTAEEVVSSREMLGRLQRIRMPDSY